jgi:phage shock protein E
MEKLKELLKQKDTTIIDVRNDWEYSEKHIEKAINIPLDQIPARLSELKNLRSPLVIYCRSGARSAMATNILKQAGISGVYDGGGLVHLQKLFLN